MIFHFTRFSPPWQGIRSCLVLLVAQLACSTSGLAADQSKLPPSVAQVVDYVHDIQPIFAARCYECHGPEKQKGGLRLDRRGPALSGGDSGKILIPGKGTESSIVHHVAGLDPDKQMPPKGEPLTRGQIALIIGWINQGAVWPEEAPAPRQRPDHWSLQPLTRPAVPVVEKNRRWVRTPVDAFILNRLSSSGLAPAAEVDRVTLIRRLSFDLLGVPPSPQEIDGFVRDQSSKAWENLVDRMLASPRYGERWGRHWLDIVRYTESQGFEYDRLRDNAWHYRDYVIRSFNEDKPYDRFMMEQIAGDVIESQTRDSIIATSLLVCGPYDEAGNAQANATQRAITREEEMEDLLAVVGQTFLGLTVNCARCHSHKFDPIPQEEYYRLRSIFDGIKHGERTIATTEEVRSREERLTSVRQDIQRQQELVAGIESEGWRKARARTSLPDSAVEPGPTPFLNWNFRSNLTADGAELLGGAVARQGRLHLEKPGAYLRSAPISRDVRERTLEAWVDLSTLDQGGGAAISIESADGSVFDAIVFGERQKRKWTAGSSGFQRTRDLDAPEETTFNGVVVHMAAVYGSDNSITLYRNGEPYGAGYKPGSPVQTYKGGSARILLGMRHTGGGKPFLTGQIIQASVHERALTAEEVKRSFRSSGLFVPPEQMLSALSDSQRQTRQEALDRLASLRKELDSIKPLPVSYVGTRVQPPPARRLRRGDVKSPEETVPPAAVSAIVDLEADFGLAPDAPESQRRIRFAGWLADSRNPLPARVMANRIWQFHFGQGIVGTPNDFGISGAKPTHPELLDWLASELLKNRWSLKSLHRLIVLSSTYRQSSLHNARAAALDADNQLLWRFPPRRLEAEVVRDAMLVASGAINWESGGPGFRPFEIQKFPANAYVPVDKSGPEFNRRTVYRMNVNSGKEPLLDAFDCPDPAVKTPRRGVTTTPLQALALMNNSFVQRQASLLADRARKEAGGGDADAIRLAYRLALGRLPAREELKLAEEAVRERGLRNLCWALLNSTEFVYVR